MPGRLTGIEQNELQKGNEFSVFPNSFFKSTNFKLILNDASFVKIELLNGLGQTLEIIENKNVNAGTFMYNWQFDSIEKGLYYLRVSINNDMKTFKLIKE